MLLIVLKQVKVQRYAIAGTLQSKVQFKKKSFYFIICCLMLTKWLLYLQTLHQHLRVEEHGEAEPLTLFIKGKKKHSENPQQISVSVSLARTSLPDH